jgi:signal transduction histidine kinase
MRITRWGGCAPVCLPALAGCSAATGTPSGPWLFAAVALVLVAALGFALGRRHAESAAQARLRDAQRERQLLAELQDGWIWSTDAGHRLQRLQPPARAAGVEWAPQADLGEPLWTLFEAGAGDELRQRLQAQQAFHGVRARRRADGSGWLLRAAPRFDDDGRFAGYGGNARPTAELDMRGADQQALQAVLAALDMPLIVAQRAPQAADDSAGWQVRRANAEARRLFESGETLPAWPEVEKRLPAALRRAIAESVESTPADGAEDHEGWRLRRYGGAEGQALLLAKLPQNDAEQAAADSASFSFTVSHDLRAPVRVVEGFTRILKEDYGRQLDRVGNDHLERVLGAAARMNQMIDALLALARLTQQPLARQPVNLSQLAAFVVDDLRRGAPERPADIEIQPGLQVQGDPMLLRLVLENLLGNAWKYTARAKKAHIVFGAEPHEGRRAFVVRDNGAGFDMRSADRLFGLFQRLHSTTDFPGTGVGLASVRRIVRRHGGEVWADAEPGRGAAFYFTLRE